MVNVRDRVSGESHRLQQGQAALAKAHRDAHRRFVQEARANARFDSMQARAAAGRGNAGTSSGPPLPPAANTKAPATNQAAPYVWSHALGLGRAGGAPWDNGFMFVAVAGGCCSPLIASVKHRGWRHRPMKTRPTALRSM